MAIRRSAVCSFFFFFNDTATTEIYTLSLHDALPISYIAGGLELSEAVSGARAAAERARAMVDGSPLPLALVDGEGRGQQLNEAGGRLFRVAAGREGPGGHQPPRKPPGGEAPSFEGGKPKSTRLESQPRYNSHFRF